MDILLLIIAGVCGGVLGGMGMGGGTLLIPMLTLFCSINQHNAQCFNLVAFIPMAIIALILHIKNKLISLSSIIYIALPATVASVLTAIFVKRIESKLLARSFGVFLILLGIYQLVDAIIRIKASKKKNEPQ